MADRPTVLLVSATDSSGGAGLAADLRATQFVGVDARIAVTAVTVQRPAAASGAVYPVDAATLAEQLKAAGEVDAVKIGLLPEAALVAQITDWLEHHELPVVLDPILAAGSGQPLATEDAYRRLRSELIPRCALVTPNAIESERLTGLPVSTVEEGESAARALAAAGSAVLVKGGHIDGDQCVDTLVDAGSTYRFRHPRRPGIEIRGTGCWLATAVAARLASGAPLPRAVEAGIVDLQNALFEVAG